MRAAFAFLTVLGGASTPTPRALRWFPIVGCIVGGLVGAVWWAAGEAVLALPAAVVAVAADLAITGMLHVDGLADASDGLLPHADRERRLRIMREPGVGAYGVAVVAITLVARVAGFASIGPDIALVAGLWCASRTSIALAPAWLPYAREEGIAKAFVSRPATALGRARVPRRRRTRLARAGCAGSRGRPRGRDRQHRCAGARTRADRWIHRRRAGRRDRRRGDGRPARRGSTVVNRLLGAAAGLALDRLLGEPPARVHPVAVFGRAMTTVEGALYQDARPSGLAYSATGVALGAGAGIVAGSTTAVVGLAAAGRMLRAQAEDVGARLEADDLDGARAALPALVGRDPDELDASAVAAAVVESVAENTVDAVVAPALWGALGGAVGAGAYRAINTMDAMIGHRSPRYARFGWGSARLDDVASYLPARVTALLVCAARPVRWREVTRRGAARRTGASVPERGRRRGRVRGRPRRRARRPAPLRGAPRGSPPSRRRAAARRARHRACGAPRRPGRAVVRIDARRRRSRRRRAVPISEADLPCVGGERPRAGYPGPQRADPWRRSPRFRASTEATGCTSRACSGSSPTRSSTSRRASTPSHPTSRRASRPRRARSPGIPTSSLHVRRSPRPWVSTSSASCSRTAGPRPSRSSPPLGLLAASTSPTSRSTRATSATSAPTHRVGARTHTIRPAGSPGPASEPRCGTRRSIPSPRAHGRVETRAPSWSGRARRCSRVRGCAWGT